MDEVKRGQILTDEEAMNLAIKVAQKGWGFVSPNPAVGCVILDKNNRFLSSGYHEKYGGAHAEVNALRGLEEAQLQGARLFVTLEPCSHHGKTPPCAEALARLPLQEVIFGLFDPNPLVQGKGVERLQAAGIQTRRIGVGRTQATSMVGGALPSSASLEQGANEETEALEAVCEHFLTNMKLGRPFVSLKVGASLDGKIALKNGESQWITGSLARTEGHCLRAYHDAILVGVTTFLSDNPALNIRHPRFEGKRNKVVVLDPTGRGLGQLAGSKLWESHLPEDIFWVCGEGAAGFVQTSDVQAVKPQTTATQAIPQAADFRSIDLAGVHRMSIPWHKDNTKSLDLEALMSQLWAQGVRSILVEGGSLTWKAFIEQNLVDRLFLFLAPMIIGGASGLDWTQGLPAIEKLSQARRLGPLKASNVGEDLIITARFTK